jgi:hypothetical protein
MLTAVSVVVVMVTILPFIFAVTIRNNTGTIARIIAITNFLV